VAPIPTSPSLLSRFVDRLHAPVPIQSLAVLRIAFGLLLAWDVWRFIRDDRISRYYTQPDFLFSYWGFSWVKPLPEPWLHIAWLGVGVLALMVAFGLLYRIAIICFTLLFAYFFLLDKAQYLNHFYMVLLYAGLLCLLPAGNALSLDAKLFPKVRRETAPYWSVWALRAQTEIILLYAGLVKITEDWLRGEPLAIWLRDQAQDLPFGAIFAHDWVILAGAWGTIALHVLGAPLLLFARTRLPVFLLYCVFHLSNGFFFNIGIFPFLTIAATTIFFAPDWPQRLLRWLLGRFEALPPMPAMPPAAPVARSALSLALIGVLVGWMVVQVLVPLRFALYPSEVRWAGEGHRFAWRMRMYDRQGEGDFEVVARDGRRWRVSPTDHLTERQAGVMLTRPDMILQFAHHLERHFAARGERDVAVHAHVAMSLNGRPFQPLIRPEIDLTTRAWSPFRAADFITPLTTPFTPWSARERPDDKVREASS